MKHYALATVTDHGAADTHSAKSLVDAIGSDTATLVFANSSGGATTSYAFGTSLSIPANVTVEIEAGAILAISGGVTVTFASPGIVSASPRRQIFSGAGLVVFTAGGIVYPEWWGVDGTADEVQINASIAALARGIVQLDAKQYVLAAAIAMKQNVTLNGVDSSRNYGNELNGNLPSTTAYKTQLYQGTAAADVIQLAGYAVLLSGVRIANLDVYGNNGTGKGISIIGGNTGAGFAVEGFAIENVTVWNFDGALGVGIYIEGIVFRGEFRNVTSHDNTLCFKATDDTYSGATSQLNFYNCSFRAREDETGGTQDYTFYNNTGGSTWGFFGCDFAKAQNAGSTGTAFYTNGTSVIVNCNFEHSDIGAQIASASVLIGCTFSDCDVTGLKMSHQRGAVINPAFSSNAIADITLDVGANNVILDLGVAPSTLTITDNAARTIYADMLEIASDGSIGSTAGGAVPRVYTANLRVLAQTPASAAAAVVVNMTSGATVAHTLTEDTTFASPTNSLAGDFLTLRVYQTAGNAFTYNLNADYKSKAALPRTVTADKVDILFFHRIGASWWEIARQEDITV